MRKQLTVISVLLALAAASCNNSSNSQHPSSKYEERKATLEDMERESPLKFLKIKGDFHGNFIRQTVVEGEITNHATLVSYKNMQLQIIYKDESGATIDKEKQLVEDVIKPGTSQSFKVKTGHVKGVASITVDITDAVAVK